MKVYILIVLVLTTIGSIDTLADYKEDTGDRISAFISLILKIIAIVFISMLL